MSRLEEIENLLKLLDITHRVIAVKDAAAHEVVTAVDFLRQTAFRLNQEKQALENKAKDEIPVVESPPVPPTQG